MNMVQNIFTHISETLVHICIAVAQHQQAQNLQKKIPFLILLLVFLRIMLRAVKLYHNFSTCNVKINNIMTKNLLTVCMERLQL